MKNIRLIISWILLLAILFLLFWLSFNAVNWLRSTDSGLAAGVVTAIAGLIGIIYSQWHSKSRDITESHRKYKIEVYETFFDIVESFLNAEKVPKDGDALPNEIISMLNKLNRGMIVWASPSVILAWLKFRKESRKKHTDQRILYRADEVFQAIRKDLGNSNFALKKGDIVRLYLKNPTDLKEEL